MIGSVIKGDTNHDELIASATASAAVDLSARIRQAGRPWRHRPGMDRLQALDRIDNAKNAVESVVRMLRTLKDLD